MIFRNKNTQKLISVRLDFWDNRMYYKQSSKLNKEVYTINNGR